ncbi:MAG: hypothetical protein FWG58_00665, partial [Methanomassiliicoccaceae archaeon]|nr:hypothetical protein [Methanomassiliicoccaceae archaeon]
MKSRPSHVPDSKNKKNLILTILIAAAFVIAALPFIVPGEGSENNDAVTLAGPPGADEQWAFGYSSPDETNVSYGGGTYSWVMDTKTLTLNNVTHITGAATALSVPNGTTIELIGTNTIESEYDGTESTYGIFSGVFTITGSGSLYAAGGTSSSSVSCGIFSSIDISIDGPEVTATGGQAIYSVGISATSSISISDAVVTATGGRGATLSYGMNANNNDSIISINASVVIAAGGNDRVSGNSYGIFAGGEMIVGGNSAVEATGSNVVTGNLSYGIYLTTESSISITGGTLTAVGSSGAISEEYEVPDGHTYWVNTATSDPGGPGTESDGSDIITTEYKYAKIKARTCIDSVKIKGVTLPVGGASPQFGTLMVVGEGYTAEVQAWRDANGDEFTGSFVAGEEYTLWTELTAESGYIFADPMTGTINGSPADHDRTIGERTWFSITFVALDVPDTTPPVLSYGSANRTSDTAAAITFITTKPGTAYCLVQNSGGTAPSD